MRLLLTTDTIGGVWTYTKELCQGLLWHGCSIALVSFGGEPNLEQVQWALDLKRKSANQFEYIPSDIPLEWMDRNESCFLDGAILLEETAREFCPDLLHSNQFCFGKLQLDLPRLIVAHSDVLSWADACKPAGLTRDPWLARYLDLVQNGLNGADAVVAPTKWMLKALVCHYTPPASQHVIANGRTLPQPAQCPVRAMQAVSAGRMWDPSKNLACLNESQIMPIFIAGSSQSESATSVSNGPLTYVNFLSEKALLDLFRSSSIYIAASLYEPFGLAPLEAALCGCAIVANDIPSFREVWGSAALYFQGSAELENRLANLQESPPLLAKMQAASLLRALQYSAETMTNRYLDLYRDLLTSSKSYDLPKSRPMTHAI